MRSSILLDGDLTWWQFVPTMAVKIQKVSIAIGREELAWVKRQARRSRSSVSAVLTEAARRMQEEELRKERQRAAWAEYEVWAAKEHGPVTPEGIEAALRELDGPVPVRRAPKRRQRRVA